MYDFDKNEKILMDAIDIAEHIGKYIKVNKGEAVCPFHDDHSPSLKISSKKQIAKCFSCGWSGNVVKFHMSYNKMNKMKAMEDLAEQYGITIDPFKEESSVDYSWTKYYNESANFLNFYLNHLIPAKSYLSMRGISDKTIEAFKIGICAKNDNLKNMLTSKFPHEDILSNDLFYKTGEPKYANRIVFPLFNTLGTSVIGWAGRYVSAIIEDKKLIGFNGDIPDPSIPKYLNTMDDRDHQGGYLKDYYLYGYHIAKSFTDVYVVEGYMDVLSMHSAGFENTVAIGGTTLTANQFNKIANKDIILAYDSDIPGIKAMLKTTTKYWYKFLKYAVYPKGCKDANDTIQKYTSTIPLKVLNLYEYIVYLIEDSDLFIGTSVEERLNWYKMFLYTAESIDASSDHGYFIKESIKLYLLTYLGFREPMLTDFINEALKKLGGQS